MSARVGATTVDPDVARAQAAEITDGIRYRTDRVPRPLRGPLEWLGDRLRPLGDLFAAVPGWVWVVLAALVLALVVYRVAVAGRRRTVAVQAAGDGAAAPATDPRELEALAARAESLGDHELAVRLRFRAGLVRLDRVHAIDLDDSYTSGRARRALGSDRFDGLADTFDDVAYGDRGATTDDSRRAREEWPEVLAAARRTARR